MNKRKGNDYQTPMLKLFSEELEGAKVVKKQLVVNGKKIIVRGTASTVSKNYLENELGDYCLYFEGRGDQMLQQVEEGEMVKILRENEKRYYFGTKEGREKGAGKDDQFTYKEVIEKIRGELGMSTAKKKLEELIGAGEKQVVLTGAPGTGKTYTATQFAKEFVENQINPNHDKKIKESEIKEFIEFVQFHSSYDYTDFVEGLRPVNINGVMTFVRLDGIFKKFCRKIVNDKDTTNKYFFIIDEINRADLSKVFGELMYGLEESYRGKEYSFQTQYMNLPTYEIDKKSGAATIIKEEEEEEEDDDYYFKEGFYIPENLIIIGTMNDIDRSVETFDFALRRRFVWVNVKVEYELGTALEGMFNEENNEGETKKVISDVERIKEEKKKLCLEHLKKGILEMNELIRGEEGKKLFLNESFQIGHAYFKKYDVEEPKKSIEKIWEYRVKPLLEEYCRGKDAGTFINQCKEKLISEINKCEDKLENMSIQKTAISNEKD